jgi:hypothetical protein
MMLIRLCRWGQILYEIFVTQLILYILQQFSETVRITDDPDKRTMLEGMLTRLSKAVLALETSVKNNDKATIEANQTVCYIHIFCFNNTFKHFFFFF